MRFKRSEKRNPPVGWRTDSGAFALAEPRRCFQHRLRSATASLSKITRNQPRQPRSGLRFSDLLSFSLVLMMFASFGCDSQKVEEVNPPEPAPKTELVPESEHADESASEEGPAEAAAGAPQLADIGEGEWCEAAHADTVKLVTAMKQTMERNKQKADEEYSVPEKAEYVALCNKLPEPMQKCLVLAHAMQNKDECQQVQSNLEGDAKAAYSELMGK